MVVRGLRHGMIRLFGWADGYWRGVDRVYRRLRLPVHIGLIGMSVALLAAGLARLMMSQSRWDPDRVVTFFYVALIYGFVPWWIHYRLLGMRPLRAAVLLVDAMVVAATAVRALGIGFPASGHVMLMGYAIATTGPRGFRPAFPR